MTTKPIEAAWEKYRRAVMPAAASRVQIEETRKGFYAGAWTLWHALMDGLEPGEPTAGDLSLLDKLNAELEAYAAEIALEARKGSSRS